MSSHLDYEINKELGECCGQGLHPLPRPAQPGTRDEEPPDERLRGPDLPRGAGQRPEA